MDEATGTLDAETLKQWIREGRKFRVIDIRSPEQHAAGNPVDTSDRA